jgi:hypothetical protein
MIRATTPTYVLTLPRSSEIDLTQASAVYFTLKQGTVTIDKEATPTDAKTVEVSLTQQETLRLQEGKQAEVQLNWIYSDGTRCATIVAYVNVYRQLKPEVLA